MKVELDHYRNRHTLTSRVGRTVWFVVWTLLCRWTPQGLGVFYAWRNMWLRIFGAKIGKRCHVYPRAKIWQPWKLTMGDCSCLSNGVDCYSVDRITLGDNVDVSADAFLCTASHDIRSPNFELTTAPITIGSGAWVCARAVVLPGVTIGECAVIACGAMVTRDVGKENVVGGNPAKFIKMRYEG